MKINKIAIIPLGLILLASSILAKEGAQESKERNIGKRHRVFKELNLSKEQLEKLKNHRKEHKGKFKDKRKEMRELRKTMNKAFLEGGEDSKIAELHRKMTSIKGEIEEARLKKMIFMKNLLNSEQRKIFIEKKSRWKGKKRKRGEKHIKK